MKSRELVLCALCAVTLSLRGPAASAQEQGSITGSVSDTSGAVVPGATVTASNSAGLKQTAVTGDDGAYSLSKMPAGTYLVTVSQEGFKDFTISSFTLNPGQAARLDVTLEPAPVVSKVSVAGEGAAAVEMQTSQLAGTITQKEITQIGLNGRNFTQLITFAPGVSNQTGQDEALVGVKGSVKYSVNGGRVEYNTFDVDGSDILNAGINGSQSTLIVFPSLDAIGELKVLTSNYGAQYGRSASGTVLVATKSGTSQFHGDAYEFVSNEIRNARNFFDQTHGAPLYRRNDFGFTIGGPLFIPHVYNKNKDKTFFFFSEEIRHERTPEDFNQAVPSPAERTGNFSDVCPFTEPALGGASGQSVEFQRSAFPDCPGTAGVDLGYFQTFPGNQVPIDPNAASLLNTGLIPAPNSTTGCNSTIDSCYDAVISAPTNWHEEIARIDHQIKPTLQVMARYIHDSWNTVNLTPLWGFVQNSFPTVQSTFSGPGASAIVRVTSTTSSSFVNDFVASYTSDHISMNNINGPGATFQRPAGLTMGYLFNNGFGGKVPGIVIGGSNLAYGGNGFAVDPSFEPWNHSNPTLTFLYDGAKVSGKHTLRFGVLLAFAQKNENNTASAAVTGDLQGILFFNNTNSYNTTGNAFADFLAGNVRAFQQDSANLVYHNRYHSVEPYLQDDWRVSPHLTLNLGLRVNGFGPWYETKSQVYNWVSGAYNPAVALGVDALHGYLIDSNQQPIPLNVSHLDPRILNGLVQCGKNRVPPSCMTVRSRLVDWTNPAPRIGFAWDPSGSGGIFDSVKPGTVSIRGGYGIFFFHGTGNEANTGSLEGSAPPVLDMTQNNPFGYGCIGGVQGNCGFSAGNAFPLNVTAIPTLAVWSYVQQWSLSLQTQLRASLVASFAYVGSKGTHLTAQRQINQLQPVDSSQNPFALGTPLTEGTCGTWDGASFQIGNTTLSDGQPGYINLEAACTGIKLTGANAGKQFPDVNSLRQFAPGLGQIFSLQNVANSTYQAFQATLRRTAGPLNLDLAYTVGRSLDDSSDRFDSTLVNSFDLRSNYAPSNFDQRQLLNVGYVYQLPLASTLHYLYKFPGKLFGNEERANQPIEFTWVPHNRFARALLEEWQLSGVTTYQTGTPFSVINNGSAINGISILDNAGVANGIGAGSYPDVIGRVNSPRPQGGNNAKSFGPLLGNPDAFAAPTGLTFGDAGRNYLRNPSRLNFDVALLKQFKLGDRAALELRGEAFNVFNHTQFRIFNPDRGNTGSNTISCYGGPNNAAGFVDPNPGGVNCLLGNSFLHPVDAHRPRTIQFGVKLIF